MGLYGELVILARCQFHFIRKHEIRCKLQVIISIFPYNHSFLLIPFYLKSHVEIDLYDRQNSEFTSETALTPEREGTLGCLLHLSPKSYNNVDLKTQGTFIEFDWFVHYLSVHTFQPLIAIYRRGNFVYHYYLSTIGLIPIYLQVFGLQWLQRPLLNLTQNWQK